LFALMLRLVGVRFAPEAAGRSQTKPFWIYMAFENALRLQ
jgi:hypothetical protein